MREVSEFHEGLLWRSDEDGQLILGFTQLALEQIGSVRTLDLPDAGDEFDSGDHLAELRGMNTSVELLAPCKLKIIEVNGEVAGQPGILEDDPTGDAWILRTERM